MQIATGIELPCEAEVGRNFVIDHFGGIIVSGYAKFGDDCRIRPGCVVGLRRIEEKCAPVIGNNVDIGAGAKILGAIRVGNNSLQPELSTIEELVYNELRANGLVEHGRRYKLTEKAAPILDTWLNATVRGKRVVGSDGIIRDEPGTTGGCVFE